MYLKNLWLYNFLKGKILWECIYLKKPDIAYLRVIGSKSWVLILKILRGGKFRFRFMIYRLLDYEGLNQYIFWELGRDIIIYARDVIIDEGREMIRFMILIMRKLFKRLI